MNRFRRNLEFGAQVITVAVCSNGTGTEATVHAMYYGHHGLHCMSETARDGCLDTGAHLSRLFHFEKFSLRELRQLSRFPIVI